MNLPEIEYVLADEKSLAWCNAHERRATHIFLDNRSTPNTARLCCDPKLGGIMIPCRCVDLTGIAEIEELPPAAKLP